jgi:GxxExxY protein
MESDISHQIIGAAIEVHRELGPGLLESAYEARLAYEMRLREISFEQQKEVAVVYKGLKIDCGFRLDFLVADRVVVELKAVDSLNAVHQAQVLTYLRLTGCNLGLLINFNTSRLTNGLKRIIWTP